MGFAERFRLGTADRLAAGASMLRDMTCTAWVESAQAAPEHSSGM